MIALIQCRALGRIKKTNNLSLLTLFGCLPPSKQRFIFAKVVAKVMPQDLEKEDALLLKQFIKHNMELCGDENCKLGQDQANCAKM